MSYSSFLKAIVDTKNESIAEQWVQTVLMHQPDHDKISPPAIIVILASILKSTHFCDQLISNGEWFSNEFCPKILKKYESFLPKDGIQSFAISCKNLGYDDVLDVISREARASSWSTSGNHLNWIEDNLCINLSDDDIVDIINKNSTSSENFDEVTAGLIFLGKRLYFSGENRRKILLKHHGDSIINILRKNEEYNFHEDFITYLIDEYLSNIKEEFHGEELELLQSRGVSKKTTMASRSLRKKKLKYDLDL